MQVDIYDFDKTMVPFDTGSLFWFYCMLRYPWIILLWPYQFIGGLLLALRIYNLTKVKRIFFSFVHFIPLDKARKKFWDKHEKDVFEWARKENRERFTVVISASPDFLLEDIAKRIGIDCLICTKHSPKNSAVIGLNCKGEEKVRRFREIYPDAQVITVYSDSLKSDRPIFSLGQNCFHIVNGERIPFVYSEKYGK